MELIHPAVASDQAEIVSLLDACGLPSADIGPHLPRFFVARDGGRLVGCIGLEAPGADGLLRSLAVAPDRRGDGIARRLYARVLASARQLGVERLFILTTDARGFFELLGFREVPRAEVPEAIRRTEQFRVLCPATAVCLARPVPRAD